MAAVGHRMGGGRKHRKALMERFGYEDNTKPLNVNGDTADHQDEEWEEVKVVI